ncbi:pentapeptide repeat-containing protein [Nocardia callitridis]|uniref:Pentapeptide repeat-containing protein n=1 Tax=Nocardia callitridis TaxID=648753 RepID=A0ABP9JUC4_9NOCA
MAVVAVAAAGWLVLVAPGWVVGADADLMSPTERASALNNARGQCLTFVTTMGGLVVIAYGVNRYYLEKDKQHLEHDKQRLDNDKHLTGLFDSAAARLASTDPTVRAGAVRTLARLMGDSPRDHMAVRDTVCDVLRHYAHTSTSAGGIGASPEIVAAVDALRQRPPRVEPRPLDLTEVQLPRADLIGANLADAILPCADLIGAKLSRAQLIRAVLTGADLTEATLEHADATGAVLARSNMPRADLTGAILREADLRRSVLYCATLRFADLTDADLTDTDLRGADLRETTGLTEAAVRETIVDADTRLPSGIGHPRLRAEE